MSNAAIRAVPRRIHRRSLGIHKPRLLETDAELLSVAGAVGSRAVDVSGKLVGRLDDLVVHWTEDEPHPPLAGVVVRFPARRAFVPKSSIAELGADELRLRHTFELRPAERKAWLVALAHDVLDRQIVDVDGSEGQAGLRPRARPSTQRAPPGRSGRQRTDAAATARPGPATTARRFGPRLRLGLRCAFSKRGAGEAGSVLQLTQAVDVLRKQGPADVQALLEDLPAHERAHLVQQVTPGAKS
jgi:hypothetical protein